MNAQQEIIPQPQRWELNKGKEFLFSDQTRILYDPEFQIESSLLFERIVNLYGIKNAVEPFKNQSGGYVYLKRKKGYSNEFIEHAEHYTIVVEEGHIVIEAYKGIGILHGIESLLQLMPVDLPPSGMVPILSLIHI